MLCTTKSYGSSSRGAVGVRMEGEGDAEVKESEADTELLRDAICAFIHQMLLDTPRLRPLLLEQLQQRQRYPQRNHHQHQQPIRTHHQQQQQQQQQQLERQQQQQFKLFIERIPSPPQRQYHR